MNEIKLLDGAMGTQLMQAGLELPLPIWSGDINITHPDHIQNVHESYLKAGSDIFIALDVAASELFEENHYNLFSENKKLDSQGMIDYLGKLIEKYPIISIEDGLAENDWDGWKELTNRLGDTCQLVGDDLFVTNPAILQKGIDTQVANSVLIKPNQIGTLTETSAAIELAVANNYTTVISHRSGETSDSTIADLSIHKDISQIKTGSLCRSDRVEKYNQLLRIESILGESSNFLGTEAFKPVIDL